MFARAAWLTSVASVLAACGGAVTHATATTPATTPAYNISCVADTAQPGAIPPEPGVSYATMIVDHTLRDYRLFQPPGLDTSKPVPLVVVLHGTPIDAAGL